MGKIVYIIILIGSLVHAQEVDKEKEKSIKIATNYTWEGNKDLSESNFVNAEANYRRAISKSTENSIAPYNLGNAYYENETYSEAFGRFKQAGENALNKKDKHKAYHNMGNVFMKNKEYQKAVDAYKEALRNDPTDEETRYNLALAKEMLKKQQEEEQKNDQNKDDQNQDDKKDQKDQNEDKKEGDENKDNKGDQKEDQGDKGEDGDKGEEKKEDKKEGEGDNEEQNDEPYKAEDQKQQQPRPSQLSPQQVKNLLEAMQNEEKKVQEKIDAQKVKGTRIKNEKDW
ncbi:tetratricopeptide repeat protein [Arenibacter sp. TNZ]|jgi:tetratricopeptide (TPR) repeat protein|uniref:tetratricopeptide repeat protein n=1 Tax=Arenibacter TaxID=178469 RepID=UPI000CD4373F|nr:MULTISPECIES: tetratricopeptide repeat protein [Arenibacter]MCM4171162.1 tetratricopeptide repeat protein [Arenibacter sp. TNZ]